MSAITEARKRVNKSVATLARECGVSRQTVYAIESSAFVPNAITALRLARALSTTVEDLFPLPAEEASSRMAKATLLPGAEDAVDRVPLVRLGTVGKRLIAAPIEVRDAFLPDADAAVRSRRGTALSLADTELENGGRVLLAGCDPALSYLRSMAAESKTPVALCQASSLRALQWLKHGYVHVAGCHVRGPGGEYNVPLIKRMFRRSDVQVITFARWQQGLVVARGNPKQIRTIADLVKRFLRLVNREQGAGSRELLDSALKEAGIPAARVRGYDSCASGHLEAAQRVQAGQADCCIATEAAARLSGLDFVPLSAERFDLVVRTQSIELATVKSLFDTLHAGRLRRRLQSLGGYDTAETGTRLL